MFDIFSVMLTDMCETLHNYNDVCKACRENTQNLRPVVVCVGYSLSHLVMLKQWRTPSAHLELSVMHVPMDLQGMIYNIIYMYVTF